MSRANSQEPRETALFHLIKHAQLALGEITGRALAPLRITGRELAVLVALDAHEPLSQQEAAGRLGVDRTTMVDLVDSLEQKELVERRPDPADRRRNIVQLTTRGKRTLRAGGRAALAAEKEFLAPLDPAEAAQLAATLQRLLAPPTDGQSR
jgi:DNA-binding MarR family transcriptional regulator